MSDELGEQVKFYKHDVSISTEWEAIVADIEETFGPINVLVNNAGVSLMKPILEMSEEEYRRVIDISKTIPMQRGAQPKESYKLVKFLASSDSSFSTGSEFILDGGQLSKL